MIDTTKTLKDPNAPIGMAGAFANMEYFIAMQNKVYAEKRNFGKLLLNAIVEYHTAEDNDNR